MCHLYGFPPDSSVRLRWQHRLCGNRGHGRDLVHFPGGRWGQFQRHLHRRLHVLRARGWHGSPVEWRLASAGCWHAGQRRCAPCDGRGWEEGQRDRNGRGNFRRRDSGDGRRGWNWHAGSFGGRTCCRRKPCFRRGRRKGRERHREHGQGWRRGCDSGRGHHQHRGSNRGRGHAQRRGNVLQLADTRDHQLHCFPYDDFTRSKQHTQLDGDRRYEPIHQ